jgi:hypothetical protein
MRVAAMGESTSMILRVHAPPCNAPAGLNETIDLYDQLFTCPMVPSATRCYPDLAGQRRRRGWTIDLNGAVSTVLIGSVRRTGPASSRLALVETRMSAPFTHI